MASERLLVSLIHYPVYTLGPGIRVGLWTQGCRIRCVGCMSQHTWAFAQEYARPIEEIAEMLWGFGCTHLTISGGEPLDQAQALYRLLEKIRPFFEDILLYTGYPMARIRQKYATILTLVDAIVDSPFRLGEETEALYKGSANQQFYLLNERLRSLYEPWVNAPKNKQLQVIHRPEGVYIIGIPYQRDIQALEYGLSESLQKLRLRESS